MREVISLHIGQAGLQIGNAIWELFTRQHKLQPDGSLANEEQLSEENLKLSSFFSQQQSGSYKARALLIDLEPTVVDQVRTSSYKNLFQQQCMVSGMEDAANNYIRGHYTLGKDIIDEVMEGIRKQIEVADSIQGFMGYNSLIGATGSGLGNLIFERLNVDFSKKVQFCCSVVPSPEICNTVVEPYNAVLGISDSMCLDLHLLVDNQALYDLCTTELQIEAPTYSNINRLIAQAISGLTLPMRTYCCNPLDLDMLQTNLVSFKRLRFLQVSHAPLVSVEHEYYTPKKTEQLFTSCFQSSFLSNRYKILNKEYFSSLYCRGDFMHLDTIQSYKAMVKNMKNLQMLDYVSSNMKLSLSREERYFSHDFDLSRTSKAVTRVFQNSAFKRLFQNILKTYDTLYAKRSFVHWYVGEGLSEGFFAAARSDVSDLAKDYDDVQTDFPDEEEQQ